MYRNQISTIRYLLGSDFVPFILNFTQLLNVNMPSETLQYSHLSYL